ncbi:MAG TPA: hypothetical protein VMH77_02465 [Steroidobacteraceae bacterium]|nr:hypothetical protein [Steroidobacteraceae bacterium]
MFQIGTSPRRIDILTRISGMDFQQAYERRRTLILEGMEVPVVSLEDLIANKRATGRTQDLADVERLESGLKQALLPGQQLLAEIQRQPDIVLRQRGQRSG